MNVQQGTVTVNLGRSNGLEDDSILLIKSRNRSKSGSGMPADLEREFTVVELNEKTSVLQPTERLASPPRFGDVVRLKP